MSTPAPKRQPIPFGKYLLLDRINIGGMAEVWRGKSFGAGGFERLVAIKRILPNIAEDEEFIHMFIDEAKITVQLAHANIAQIYELNHIGSSYYIAMEYISGKDLRAIFDRCRKKGEPAPVQLTCYLISKVCEALDYAHRKKDGMGRDMSIVHRDVSPQNVLISYEGEIKVIDFGIAKAAGKATKTQAGILKGKFGYMSPEQIRGLPLDGRSDIFGVGICLYEMLTGERLFVGDSEFSVLEKVRKAEVLSPSTFNRRIPEALEKIVLKALAREVAERYQYASELGDDLQRFLLTSDSIFSRKDLTQYMKSTFAEEVEREKNRIQEYASVQAPEGMKAAAETGFGEAPLPLPAPAPSAAPVPRLAQQVAPVLLTPVAGSAAVQPRVAPVLAPIAPPQPPALPLSGGRKVSGQALQLTGVSPAKNGPVAVAMAEDDDEEGATVLVDGYDLLGDLAESQRVLGQKRGAAPTGPGQVRSSNLKSTWIAVVGIASFALALVVLGVSYYLRTGQTELLLVEVPVELRGKARVVINGQEARAADGKPVSEWPLLRPVPTGKAVVVVTADGYESFTATVLVRAGQVVTAVQAKLKPLVTTVQLIVQPEPESAEVRVDGELVKPQGQGGLYMGEMTSGAEHRVEVTLAGYRPFRRLIAPQESSRAMKVAAALEPFEYLVTVTSRPRGAAITAGGRELGLTPGEVKVPGGTTEILLAKKCYQRTRVPVALPPEPSGVIAVSGTMKKQPDCE